MILRINRDTRNRAPHPVIGQRHRPQRVDPVCGSRAASLRTHGCSKGRQRERAGCGKRTDDDADADARDSLHAPSCFGNWYARLAPSARRHDRPVPSMCGDSLHGVTGASGTRSCRPRQYIKKGRRPWEVSALFLYHRRYLLAFGVRSYPVLGSRNEEPDVRPDVTGWSGRPRLDLPSSRPSDPCR